MTALLGKKEVNASIRFSLRVLSSDLWIGWRALLATTNVPASPGGFPASCSPVAAATPVPAPAPATVPIAAPFPPPASAPMIAPAAAPPPILVTLLLVWLLPITRYALLETDIG